MSLKIFTKNKLTINLLANKIRNDSRKNNLKREKKMATPIAPTPKLSAKASKKFLNQVENDLKRPVDYVPTPKLPEARKKIKKYAQEWKK